VNKIQNITPGVHAMLFVRTRIFGIREIWYAMVFVTNKIAER